MDSNARSTDDGGAPKELGEPGIGWEADAEAERVDAAEPSTWPVVNDPSEWFARPLVDGAGLGGPAGAVLAGKIEEVAARVLSVNPDVQARLSRHDTVSFVSAVTRQIAHLEALLSQAAAVATLDAAYHECDRGWDADDGNGRPCVACTYPPLVLADTDDGETIIVPATVDGEPDPDWPRMATGHASPVGQVGLELSAALQVSPTYATGLVDRAVDLSQNLPATWTALADGRIDGYRARIIAETTRPLVDNIDPSLPESARFAEQVRREGLRAAVEAQVLAKADSQTAEQLARRARRLVLRADPTLPLRARRVGTADRRLSQPTTRGDQAAAMGGIGAMSLFGPIEDLQALYSAADAAARHARVVESDPRSLDQLRFDIVTGMGWAGLRTGHLGCCATDHQPVDVSPRRVSGEVDGPRDGTVDGTDVAAPTAAETTVDGAVPIAKPNRRAVQIRVTVSLATLIGAAEDPGELAGVGPVPAHVVRALAFSDDATWRRLVTDPVAGTLLDYGHTTYRPPARLDAVVRARDGTCRFPTTVTPAESCDLDHVDPYLHDDHDCPGATCDRGNGRTAADNLAANSRRPHVARTRHHWQLTQPRAGWFHWTSPAGHRYLVEPDPLTDPDPAHGVLRRDHSHQRAERTANRAGSSSGVADDGTDFDEVIPF